MSWVVDTCVIIDIVCADEDFALPSAKALMAKANDGLLISPITYIELAPAFNGDVEFQNRTLAELQIEVDFGENREAILSAYKSWFAHISRKRSGKTIKRPIADVMIGAYATQKDGLITRNEDDFRALFPDLPIFNPAR